MSKAALPIIGQQVIGQQMFDRVPVTYYALRERARERAVPMHALIYLENRCNLKCQHCYEDEISHPPNEQLSLAEITDVLEQLAALGTLQLTFTGGEIFLRRDLLDILAVAKKLRFQITIFTSGYFIDRAMAKKLKQLVGQVDISVYSDIAKDHDEFTQIPGSWKRSTDALRFLADEGMKTALKCVLMTFNVDRMDGIIGLAKSLGAVFQFDPTVQPRMSGDKSPLRFAVSPKVLSEKVFARRDLYPGYQTVTPDRICKGADFIGGADAMCGAGSSTMSVNAAGDILPCGFFPAPIGNVRTQRIKDVWERSALLQDMRKMTYEKMSECPSCDVRSACHPCMAYAQVEHGDYKKCNTASRTSAEGLVALSARATRTNEKFARAGRALPIVGETKLPEVDGTASGALAMFDG